MWKAKDRRTPSLGAPPKTETSMRVKGEGEPSRQKKGTWWGGEKGAAPCHKKKEDKKPKKWHNKATQLAGGLDRIKKTSRGSQKDRRVAWGVRGEGCPGVVLSHQEKGHRRRPSKKNKIFGIRREWKRRMCSTECEGKRKAI